jgi:hypothetical protein
MTRSNRGDGGRDRDRTCDPYHVKKACGVEAVGNQGICVPIYGNSGGCSKDVPPPVVAYDQRALPNWRSRHSFKYRSPTARLVQMHYVT